MRITSTIWPLWTINGLGHQGDIERGGIEGSQTQAPAGTGREGTARRTVPPSGAGIPVRWRRSDRQRCGSAGSDGNPVGVYKIPRELERPPDAQVVHR